MKQFQAENAYNVLGMISSCKLAPAKAYKLWNLAKKLEEIRTFGNQERMKLIKRHGGVVGEGGYITFADKEREKDFINEANELGDIDVGEFEPVHIDIRELGDTKLAMQDMVKLEGFVIFDDGDIQ